MSASESRIALTSGWDSAATLVDGGWIERTPRRPEVAALLRSEAALLPWLAARLPLPVPEPVIVSAEPLVLRHRLVPGEPAEDLTAADGQVLGGFLRALHDTDLAAAVRHGLSTSDFAELDRFRDEVVPLVPDQPRALALLAEIRSTPKDAVVHGDLGPEHVLVAGGALSGVIDWSDAHVGDAAIDLAWALYGTPAEFADALAASYGVTEELRRRALLWHRLGPWYEVTYGMDIGEADTVRSGLEGVLSRL